MFGRRKKPATPQAAPQAAARSEETELDKAVRRIDANDPSLTVVNLNGKRVDDAGAKKVAAALRHNATLTSLYLSNNNIGVEGGKALAEALRHNATLTTLWLGSNSIGDEGGKALADALRHNTTLTLLDLGNNGIGDEGGKAIAEALRHNTTLTVLALGVNSIGDEGGKAIAEALRHNTTLTLLGLDDNSIGGDIKKKVVQEAERRKVAEFGPPAPMQAAVPFKGGSEYEDETVSSEFYAKLMEEDDRPIVFKISELPPLIEDVHHAVMFYTLVNYTYQTEEIKKKERSRYALKGLEVASTTTGCTESVALFKLLLQKAENDGTISEMQRHMLDREAEVTHTSHAPFVQDLRNQIRSNTARIEGLEANTEALSKNFEKLKAGIRYQRRVDMTVGFMGAVLNAVSFGIAGSVLQASASTVIGQIVDFGDLTHIEAVVSSAGDISVAEAFEKGLSAAESWGDAKFYQYVDEMHPITTITIAAKMSQSTAQHVIPTVPVAVPVANTLDGGAPPVTSLIDRVKRLEEYLPPEEVMMSVSDRVSSVELLMYGPKQKESSTGSLLERVTHLERDLGIE